ncbi:MAG: phosphatase PAP2 family protein [Lachnospiraceae bacterium]|nr:phosphatase PAP2 family protein [Lachnospiraceae bacterium]
MKNKRSGLFFRGSLLFLSFIIWTVLVQTVDVQFAGVCETKIGFATFNVWFHKLIGVHMWIYTVTDWLGLVPVFVCLGFGMIGFIQLIKRRSLMRVDCDIIFLGVYYVLVILGYLMFEMIPINYRPILIEGRMEASYPSSTTLLVLSVMPTLVFQVKRRLKNERVQKGIIILTIVFSVFMVVGRLFAGVHWFTDIVGSVLLSAGLFSIYKAMVFRYCKET